MAEPVPASPPRLAEFLSGLAWPLAPAQLATTTLKGTANLWLDGYDHYDRVRCLLNARDYARAHAAAVPGAADLPWDAAVDAACSRYGGKVLADGGITAWHAYSGGFARLYLDAPDRSAAAARDCLQVVRLLTPAVSLTKLDDWYGSVGLSREVAFMLGNALAAQRCGLGPVATVDRLAALAVGHLRQWAAPPAVRPWAVWVKPFMVGLTCLALIDYASAYPPTSPVVAPVPAERAANLVAIPGAVAGALAWLWEHCWLPTHKDWPHGSFVYMDLEGKTSLPTVGPLAIRSVVDRRHLDGPETLPARDGHFDQAMITFTSGPAKGRAYRVLSYAGATRTFTLAAEAAQNAPPVAGDLFTLDSTVDRDGAPLPTADLNHLISPAFAWVYAQTGEPAWRERHDAVFAGGAMCWGPPTAQKQWNQAWYAGPSGLAWRAAGAALEGRATAPKPEPEPTPEPTPEPEPEPGPPEPFFPRDRSFLARPTKVVPFRVDITFPPKKGGLPGEFDVVVKAREVPE